MPKKIIVTGGRSYPYGYEKIVYTILNELNPDIIVHGNAKGIDTLCKQWAENNNKEHKPYDADWDKHGKSAGPIRNTNMILDNLDAYMGIVFAGGRGTADCKYKLLQHLGEDRVFILKGKK